MNIQQLTPENLCQAPLSFTGSIISISLFCVAGLLWALYNYKLVHGIDVRHERRGSNEEMSISGLNHDQKLLLIELGSKIS